MVSVIMSTYKEPKSYVKLSVESILNQSYKSIEYIVIVDDPTNIDLIDLLKNYAEKDKRIRFFINNKNLGLTASLNRALQYANGEYIARMDADDISSANRIEEQLAFLQRHNLDLVGGNVQDIDENGNILSNPTVYPKFSSSISKKAEYSSPLAHPTWLGKKEVFERLNGYQEIDACEDYDFLVRAILAGFKIGNVQATVLQYRINPHSISSTKKARQKTALFFVRENYRRGRVTTEAEYCQFMESPAGQKKLSDLEEYYRKTSKMKKMSRNKITKALYMATIFVTCNEARLLFANTIKEKLYVR